MVLTTGQHLKQFPNQPLCWIENEGWYQEWENAVSRWHYAGHTDDCGKHSELGDKAYTISIDIREHSLILLSVSLGKATHTSPGSQASSLYRGITGSIMLGRKDITKGQ